MIDPAHLTDAELAAWYGSGLHAPKAQRLIEEVRRLRARLAEVEAERDKFEGWYLSARGMAERDAARLAAVKALCDQRHAEHGNRVLYGGTPAPAWLTTDKVLAAARGEGDRG